MVERLGRPPVYVEHLLVGMYPRILNWTSSRGPSRATMTVCTPGCCSPGRRNRRIGSSPTRSRRWSRRLSAALARLVDFEDQEDGVFASRAIELSAQTFTAFEDFRAQHHKAKAAEDGREREWFAKGPTQVLRLAATLALMDWAWRGGLPPSEVEAASVESRRRASARLLLAACGRRRPSGRGERSARRRAQGAALAQGQPQHPGRPRGSAPRGALQAA